MGWMKRIRDDESSCTWCRLTGDAESQKWYKVWWEVIGAAAGQAGLGWALDTENHRGLDEDWEGSHRCAAFPGLSDADWDRYGTECCQGWHPGSKGRHGGIASKLFVSNGLKSLLMRRTSGLSPLTLRRLRGNRIWYPEDNLRVSKFDETHFKPAGGWQIIPLNVRMVWEIVSNTDLRSGQIHEWVVVLWPRPSCLECLREIRGWT